jgi:acid phosphatase type 7
MSARVRALGLPRGWARWRGLTLPAAVLASTLVALGCVGAPAIVAPTPSTSAVLVGAGDIGLCGSEGALETGRLIDSISGTVIAVGDLAYPAGTKEQFETCYEAAWGRHKRRTRPAPGNHEYDSPFAQPYFNYFGSAAGPQGLGYYSFTAGPWFVLSLNSNISSLRASEQGAWVRSQLQANNTRCSLAYFHHPLISSGPNGDNPALAELWSLLYEAGVDIVVSAHDHLYERSAPMAPTGQRDLARGIRQFVVGTGGAESYPAVRAHPNSERIVGAHGVLRLTLTSDGYEWEFLLIGGVRGDSGIGTCH